MFNPLKMSSDEKQFLIGGLLSSITAYAEKSAEFYVPGYPTELKTQIDPHLPTNGQILSLVAPPVVLKLGEKIVKSGTTKEKLGKIGFGSLLFSAPRLVQQIGSNSAYAEGVKARGAFIPTPVAVSKYALTAPATNARATTTRVAPTVGLSKYTVIS